MPAIPVSEASWRRALSCRHSRGNALEGCVRGLLAWTLLRRLGHTHTREAKKDDFRTKELQERAKSGAKYPRADRYPRNYPQIGVKPTRSTGERATTKHRGSETVARRKSASGVERNVICSCRGTRWVLARQQELSCDQTRRWVPPPRPRQWGAQPSDVLLVAAHRVMSPSCLRPLGYCCLS